MGDYLIPMIWLIAGLAVLIGGGELLVRGASALAAVARISPLVIGLTVVAFGTSAPELAVSVQSAFTGQADLAIGNVVGSNIANVLLILGLSALVAPLVVSSQLVRIDVPLMIVVSFLMLVLAWDGAVSRVDGCILFVGLLGYVVWSIRQGRRESGEVVSEFSAKAPVSTKPTALQIFRHLGLILIGLVLLGVGSRWLVSGSVDIARLLGVRELVIGLTIVAVGTSFPELVTSIVASVRGQREIAVGNVVGSNLFNILCVLGLSGIVAPDGIGVSPAALRFDIPVMIAVAVACLPIFFTGNLIARWEGGLFFGYYLAYATYLVLAANQASVTRTFGVIMIAFVIPLTVITLAVGATRTFRVRSLAKSKEENASDKHVR
ncbi:MAG: calcium/sodium antiporter [Planctomycetes bacterium]|nr:calcium/sodium antiporter [Planctomycetota bacterium]